MVEASKGMRFLKHVSLDFDAICFDHGSSIGKHGLIPLPLHHLKKSPRHFNFFPIKPIKKPQKCLFGHDQSLVEKNAAL